MPGESPPVRALLIDGVPARGSELGDPALAAAYAYRPTSGRTRTRANMVATLDGAAVGADGRSGSINTGADRKVFALLRALADVILVGAGTARVERYRRPDRPEPRWARLREGRTPAPAIAVVSASGRLPDRLGVTGASASPERPFAGRASTVRGDAFLITCQAADPPELARASKALGPDRVLLCGTTRVRLDVALERLADLGLCDVLCEGGPHLLAELTAAGLLDELCLTIAPTLLGGPAPRILGPDAARHGAASTPMLPYTLLESDATLLGRWVRG